MITTTAASTASAPTTTHSGPPRSTDPAAAHPGPTLAGLAAGLAARINPLFSQQEAPIRHVLALAEEAGEFVGAYRRWAGMARRTGGWSEVQAELADVVITAYLTAHTLGIDLDAACQDKAQVIRTRGWKDPR